MYAFTETWESIFRRKIVHSYAVLVVMTRFLPILSTTIALTGTSVAVTFNDDVRPILSDRCFACHGPDMQNQKGDLRLDNFEGAVKDGVVVPGKPDESELMHRILSHDPDEHMPPPEAKLPRLTDAEIANLRQWITEGAEYQEHWAFLPVNPGPVPQVDSELVKNPIDSFVFARLEKDGLSPQPEAERPRLIRRVTFDLTGLPPTPEEVAAFVADTSPDAYEKVVDRLLASPRYGERMAVNWLDLSRYADTYGMQVDRDRDVSPWRDWVIKAFNENYPYDQFVTWQLAGDLLPNPTDEQILATTFNRLHQQKVEGGSVEEEFRVEYVADRTHTFGTAFLGLTLECSRCHDHKFDPVTQMEYYQLSAFFQNIDEAGLYSYFTSSVPTPTLRLMDDAKKAELAGIESEIAEAEKSLPAGTPWTPDAVAAAGVELGRYAFEDKALANAIPGGKPASTNANNKFVPGKEGNAVLLTGDDVVNLPFGNFRRWEPFSVSLWMQAPEEMERAVVFHRSRAWTDAASRGYEMLIEDGRLKWSLIHFWPGNAISIRTKEKISPKEWAHVAVSYDGSSRAAGLSIYVNGKRAETEVVRDNLYKEITGGGGDNIAIGERFRDRGFKGGMVDDFRVFNRALEFLGETDAEALAKLESVRALRQKRSGASDKIREIMVMREMSEPKQGYRLDRGMYDQRREPVAMETPAFLPPFPKDAPRNRLGLAQWLLDPGHPLTSRTAVNRFWGACFGFALVKTAEDFGSQGTKPRYRELLDWLSEDFMQSGWDIKRLMKTIVTSHTYRQNSLGLPDQMRDDPENELLSRGPRHRLTAEMIRDNALAVSGLLVEKVGGPSVKPYEIAESFTPSGPDKGENLYRRSLYSYWKITGPAPAMVTFNAVKRDVCSARRERTSSPLQALILLNGPQFTEAARVLGEKLHKENAGAVPAIIGQAFQLLLSRAPDERELAVCTQLYEEQLADFKAAPAEAEKFLTCGQKPRDATLPAAEVAAASVLVSTLMNHDECVMKR